MTKLTSYKFMLGVSAVACLAMALLGDFAAATGWAAAFIACLELISNEESVQ